MKIAWPSPGFIVFRHIAQVLLDPLGEEDLGKRRPEDEGVGVLGRRKRDRSVGEREAASENLAAELAAEEAAEATAAKEEEGGGSSRVWGT